MSEPRRHMDLSLTKEAAVIISFFLRSPAFQGSQRVLSIFTEASSAASQKHCGFTYAVLFRAASASLALAALPSSSSTWLIKELTWVSDSLSAICTSQFAMSKLSLVQNRWQTGKNETPRRGCFRLLFNTKCHSACTAVAIASQNPNTQTAWNVTATMQHLQQFCRRTSMAAALL